MARPSAHSFAKRQKELKRLKKQQDKRLKRQSKIEDEAGEGGELTVDAGNAEPNPDAVESVEDETDTSESPETETES